MPQKIVVEKRACVILSGASMWRWRVRSLCCPSFHAMYYASAFSLTFAGWQLSIQLVKPNALAPFLFTVTKHSALKQVNERDKLFSLCLQGIAHNFEEVEQELKVLSLRTKKRERIYELILACLLSSGFLLWSSAGSDLLPATVWMFLHHLTIKPVLIRHSHWTT